MAAVTLQQVKKSFGPVDVIRGVDLSIVDGEFMVFVGPSGCGKSTLLRLISGLETCTDGTIAIDNADVTQVDAAERGVAMVFQSYALYPHMTVKQNMSFGLRMTGHKPELIEQRVTQAAKTLALDALLDRKPAALSGGQRQRVAIGRAIVREPKVFLFDEPLSNLDAELRVQMRLEIKRLHRTLNNTMVYVTHDQTEAMTLADRIVVLRDGVIEQVGTPLELYDTPDNEFVAGFIGSPRMNFVDATVIANPVDDTSQNIQLQDLSRADGTSISISANTLDFRPKPGSNVRVGLRPEHFVEQSDYEFVGTIIVLEQLGGVSYAYVDTSNGLNPPLIVQLSGHAPYRDGDKISVGIDPARCHIFDSNGQRHPSQQ